MKIEEILNKGKTPIVIGGTGLYADSLIYGIEYPEIEFDEIYRQELEEKASYSDGLKELYEQAEKIDGQAIEKISPNDKKRILRILEIYNATGKTKTELEAESRKNGVKYDFRVFAIDMNREILYDRINKRVDIMIENGLIDEVRELLQKYDKFPTAMQGLGYKEVVEYLDGKLSKEEMIEKIKLIKINGETIQISNKYNSDDENGSENNQINKEDIKLNLINSDANELWKDLGYDFFEMLGMNKEYHKIKNIYETFSS